MHRAIVCNSPCLDPPSNRWEDHRHCLPSNSSLLHYFLVEGCSSQVNGSDDDPFPYERRSFEKWRAEKRARLYPNFRPCFRSVSELPKLCCDRFGLAVRSVVEPRRIDVFLTCSARLKRNRSSTFVHSFPVTVAAIVESSSRVWLHRNRLNLDESHAN